MERYVIRGGREGFDRLQVLGRVRWPDTSELLHRAGVRPGMRSIDVGCGGGDVTLELARLVGPEGHVTGIDLDEVKIALARDAAVERTIRNVEFRTADVNEWEEADSYDLVYSRLLLEHLSRPADLVRRMWAAVKGGGVVAIEDGDFEGLLCEPPNPGFDFYKRMYPRLLELHGGDPTAGRKLYRYALEAGVPTPAVRLVRIAATSGEAKTLSLLSLRAIADAILAAGLASVDDLESALAGLEAFTDDPTTLIAGPGIFQVWARRD